ncbi:MAG: transcriptional repressor [Spirochaetaceae bacterium]|jgi:Fur family ferric uptake transcriptional regulator|nr:transcriptional repressor [Spirochaetaceae bacterium]
MEHKRPANYHTRQGQSILDYVKSLGDGHVTVNQIARHFEDANAAIGQTTIYRHLERLTAQGKLRKDILHEDKSACYQYIHDEKKCREHIHLKCEICGALIHLDCELLTEIEEHFLSSHDFHLNMLKTVFYGTCKKCVLATG